ncbi:hypothetical protein PHJA_000872400 [Phtheirospermum japonicum]|uniref:Uncharacterized protein n=1 Tax=Phtheirospermum japonicum TaxID=374723 RepID=A0A830BIS4_9LAMI|nr:hypothetical protein PHJA_000872400 [Phtheirospermum japonicum]
MSGLSIGRSHPRPCSGAKTLRRCRNNNVEADNVILIDVETDSFDNVIIIDVPDSLPNKTQCLSTHHRKDKKPSFKNVICIDDDESLDISHSFGFSAGTSSKNFADASTPVRLSKCKRTYSGNASRSNRFGLNGGSETDSSDSDYPDCELVEDSSGEVQERWEKAFSKRKRDFRNGHSDIRDDNNEKGDDSSRFGTKGDVDFGWDETGNSTSQVEENRKRTPKFKSRVDEESMNEEFFETKTLPHEQTDHSSARLSDDEKGFVSRNSSLSKGFLGRVLRTSHDKEAKLQEEDISMSNIQQEEDKDGENSPPCEETCIINEREKHKETDEYKRAMEEEWASRQQALQIQAEEAKNLRRLLKRRKAESLRLLDVERRQKERIEEVRNSQKKDEENMNLKERVQAEVRSELKRLEVSCHRLVLSIFSPGPSGLGQGLLLSQAREGRFLIDPLGLRSGWPGEPEAFSSVLSAMGWAMKMLAPMFLVQAAYKRALLTFHPDRASQSDIRQQVEAEEKFKLMNRLKEKYKPL